MAKTSTPPSKKAPPRERPKSGSDQRGFEKLVAKADKALAQARAERSMARAATSPDPRRLKRAGALAEKFLAQAKARATLTAKDPAQALTDKLARAIWAGSMADVRALLSLGASLSQADAAGRPPLHIAAGQAKRLSILRLLIERGAKDAPGEDGRSALHHAIAAGHDKYVELLLAAGCDPRARDAEGFTPLMSAVLWSRFDAARRLAPLSDIDARCVRKFSARDYAEAHAKDAVEDSPAHAFLAFLDAMEIAEVTATAAFCRDGAPRL